MSSNTVEKVGTRTRAAECKLRDVKYLETAGLIVDATEQSLMGQLATRMMEGMHCFRGLMLIRSVGNRHDASHPAIQINRLDVLPHPR